MSGSKRSLVEDAKLLYKIRNARDTLRAVTEIECTCSGFTLQLDRCQCSKKSKVEESKYKLNRLIESI